MAPIDRRELAALLIGIDDYGARGSLQGAVNDVAAWWRFCVDRLRLPPERVWVLTSPPIGARDLAQRAAGEDSATLEARVEQARASLAATRAQVGNSDGASSRNIGAAVGALNRGLVTESARKGLLVFSGHGIAEETIAEDAPVQFALAGAEDKSHQGKGADPVTLTELFTLGAEPEPSPDPGQNDPSQGDPGQSQPGQAAPSASSAAPAAAPAPSLSRAPMPAIPGAPSAPALVAPAGPSPQDRLTVVVDACFGQPATPANGTVRTLSDVELPTGSLDQFLQGAGRVLLACGEDEVAVELPVGGRVMGAFTHAVLTLADRWTVANDPLAGFHLSVTHGELMRRAAELLCLLGVPQRPRLAGRAGVSFAPVLSDITFLRDPTARAMAVLEDLTDAEPNRPARYRQIEVEDNGFVGFDFEAGDLGLIGRIAVLGADLPPVSIESGGGGGLGLGALIAFLANREYWWLDPAKLMLLRSRLQQGTVPQLTIKKVVSSTTGQVDPWFDNTFLVNRTAADLRVMDVETSWEGLSNNDPRRRSLDRLNSTRLVWEWVDGAGTRRALQLQWSSTSDVQRAHFLKQRLPLPGETSFFGDLDAGDAATATPVPLNGRVDPFRPWWAARAPLEPMP